MTMNRLITQELTKTIGIYNNLNSNINGLHYSQSP
jgi:hypothetical protein